MNLFAEANQYHKQVAALGAKMYFLARNITKARYNGDLALAERLHYQWEMAAERKTIALDNEIACRHLFFVSALLMT